METWKGGMMGSADLIIYIKIRFKSFSYPIFHCSKIPVFHKEIVIKLLNLNKIIYQTEKLTTGSLCFGQLHDRFTLSP
jgi:hypothetical protein